MSLTRRDFLTAAGASLLMSPARAAALDLLQIEGKAFGAGWRVRAAADADPGQIIRAVAEVVTQIDGAMSPFRPDSEVSRFNARDTREPVALSLDLFDTVREAKRVAMMTCGSFDPTMGGLVGRYGFGPITRPPAGRFADLALTPRGVVKAHPLQTLDLCGIAKGHALDLVAARLRDLGHSDFFLELGGEVTARGHRPGGGVWRAGIEDPRPDRSGLLLRVAISGEALATSGNRVNSYVVGTRRYSHIIDPDSLRPVQSPLASVSVFAPTGRTADALATALFAMGPDRGAAFAEREGIPALFVSRFGTGLVQKGTAGFFARAMGKGLG